MKSISIGLVLASALVACPAPPVTPPEPVVVAPRSTPMAIAPDRPLHAFTRAPSNAVPVHVFRLPTRPPTSSASMCVVADALTRIGESCARIEMSKLRDGTGPGYPPGTNAYKAFDADACSVWNSGAAPPQAVRAELAIAEHGIDGVFFVPEMTPDGSATHVIDVGGTTFVAAAKYVSQGLYFIVFDPPLHAREITVHTIAGPSWVAWRDVTAFTCAGTATIPSEATDETSTAIAR